MYVAYIKGACEGKASEMVWRCLLSSEYRKDTGISWTVYLWSYGADIYTHLYIGNQTYIPVNNDVVKITMDSMFPWEGNIKVKVQGVKEKVRLHFRIPSYAEISGYTAMARSRN